MFLFFLTLLGSSIFALGLHFKEFPYLLPMMLPGRLLSGFRNGSLTSKEFTFMYFCIFGFMSHQRVMIHFCLLDPCPTSHSFTCSSPGTCVVGRLLLHPVHAEMLKSSPLTSLSFSQGWGLTCDFSALEVSFACLIEG